jgi:hypothetical protein
MSQLTSLDSSKNFSQQLSTLVQEYLSSSTTVEQEKKLLQILNEVQENHITFLQFVQCLGESLVSPNEIHRAKGVVF